MKFKVGQKVRVIDSAPEQGDVGPGWVLEMDDMCGKEFVVLSAHERGKTYYLEEGAMRFWFLEDWLLPVEQEKASLNEAQKEADYVSNRRDDILRRYFP